MPTETRAGPLDTLACALAGDTAGAAALLAAARSATDRAGRPAEPGFEDDPEAAARAALVQAYLRTGRRRAPRDAEPLPDPELEAVRVRLDALAPLPRALLVLRNLEGLTLADLARATERSGPALARALETATESVGATGYQLELVAASVRVPEPGEVETARRALTAHRRRTRTRWVLAALVVAALVTAATVLPGVLRPDPYARAVGAWVYGYEIRPTAGFRVLNRFLTPDTDTVRLLDETPSGAGRRTCDLTATSSERPEPAPAGRAVRVGTFAGRFVEADRTRGPALWWRPAPRLAMEVSCSRDTTDDELLAVAALAVPAEVPVLVPIDLTRLPPGEQVRGIYDLDSQIAMLVLPPGETEESLNAVYVTVGGVFTTASYRRPTTRTVQLGSVTAQVQRAGETTTVCWDLGGTQACVADFISRDNPTTSQDQRLERLLSIARLVRTAPDPRDPSTWFDARDAVPG